MTNRKEKCVFCEIVEGNEFCWKIWENEEFIAFLTPFPNTKGFTVLASKKHLPSDIFDLTTSDFHNLFDAAKKVATLLNESLGTKRTAMIAEGMGINHAHLKLIPLHGISEGSWKAINSNKSEVFESYPGYISSHDGPRVDKRTLDELAEIINNR